MSAVVKVMLRLLPRPQTVMAAPAVTFILRWCLLFSVTTASQLFVKGEIYPTNNWFFVGHNMTVFCRLYKATPTENASHLYFAFEDKNSPISPAYVTVVNETTIRLHYLITEPFRGKFLGCYLNHTNGSIDEINYRNIYADYPPKEIKNFTCVMHDWNNMTCSWDSGHKYSKNVQTELCWRIVKKSDWSMPCPKMAANTYTWNGTSFRDDEEYEMKVTVSSKSPLPEVNKTSKTFKIDSTAHVKPASPDYSVQQINSTCLQLNFSHRKDGRATVKIIEFQSEWDRNQYWSQENLTDHKKLEKTICDLIPFTNYTLRVAVRYLEYPYTHPVGFPSDWRYTLFCTPASVPEVAPDMCDSCFTRLSCETNQCQPAVLVYWKAIPKPSRYSIISGYRLKVKSGEIKESIQFISSTETSWRLQLSPEQTHSIQLFAVTAAGNISSSYSQILLYPSKNTPAAPRHFVVETDSEFAGIWSKTFYLTWLSAKSTVTRHTVFWCRGSKWRKKCDPDNEVHYITVPRNESSYVLEIPPEDAGRKPDDYLVGLASQVGRSSSGILWISCFYLKDTVPPLVRDVRASPVVAGLEVAWSRQGCFHPQNYVDDDSLGYTISYNVTWCSTLSDDTCRSVVVDQDTDRYTLKGLTAGTRYQVKVTPISPWGSGSSTSVVAEVPGKPSTTDAVKIVLVGFFVLVIITLIVFGSLYLKRRWKKYSKKFNVSYPRPADWLSKGLVSTSSPPATKTRIFQKNDFSRRPLLSNDEESSDVDSTTIDLSAIDRQLQTVSTYLGLLADGKSSVSTDQAYESMDCGSERASPRDLQTDLSNSSSSAEQAVSTAEQCWTSTHGEDLHKDDGWRQTARDFRPQASLSAAGRACYVQASLASQAQQYGEKCAITRSFPISEALSRIKPDSFSERNVSQNGFVAEKVTDQSAGCFESGSQIKDMGASSSPTLLPMALPYVSACSIPQSVTPPCGLAPSRVQPPDQCMNQGCVPTLPPALTETSPFLCTSAPKTFDTTGYVPNYLPHEMQSTLLSSPASSRNPQNSAYVSMPPLFHNVNMAYIPR